MSDLYDRYLQGFYQEVYNELLAMQEHIFDSQQIYQESLLIMRELMRRVQANIEHLLPRLQEMGFLFRKGGFWENYPPEKRNHLERDYPIFQPSTPETPEQVATLEQLVGSLPMSLKCWYEEVGCVNLVGLFSSNEREYGCVLDPLWVNSVEATLQMVTSLKNLGILEQETALIIAPDCYHKYGFSGGGAYTITVPCKAFDALLGNEPHQTTFVNYLRICFQWGGFPGLEQENRLAPEKFEYLTKDLLLF